MKTIIIKSIFFFVALPFVWESCTKETVVPPSIYAEINGVPVPLNNGDSKISIESNGIGIEFCLLNEAGEPATTFEKGENFKFHLAITNNVSPDSSMYIVSDFLRNPDLFKVYNAGGKSKGQPIEWNGMDKVTDVKNGIVFGEKWTLNIPWHDTENSFRVFQHYFKGANRSPLPRGSYYTKLTQQFCLGRYLPHPQHEEVCTDTLTLKINFEIK